DGSFPQAASRDHRRPGGEHHHHPGPAGPCTCDADQPAAATLAAGLAEPGLDRQIHKKALAAATEKFVSCKQLARLAGYRCNSYFRDAVRELVRAGRLRHTADGYSLPGNGPV